MYYWTRDDGQTIDEAFETAIRTVPYFVEPQGEAVCWAHDSSGYYTLSEGSHPHLYFYPRLSPTNVQHERINPDKFTLEQNYPNPFNPSTKIEYRIKETAFVSLIVYDMLAREVGVIVNKEQQPGNYEVKFSASDLPSGMYFYRINAGNFTDGKKMLLIK